jgi:hypothetical protein
LKRKLTEKGSQKEIKKEDEKEFLKIKNKT